MESSGSGPGERPSPGSRKPAILRMTVARPTIMRIMRPPSPGDIMELTPASIPPSSSFSDDHDNQQQQQQQQSNTSNSSTIQIILNSNSPGNSQQTITLNQQQQPTGATNPFACNHCHWTSDSEERLLEHICAVHLETRANREDQEETSNNTGEQRGNKRKLKVVRISSSATGASNRRKQRMPSSTTSAAQQPKTTDDTSSSSANNETSTTTASTAHFHYVCQFLRCSKRFAKLDQLRQHHRGHLNLKPYHCTWPGCAQYFSRRPAALRHIRTSHFKVQREQLPELSAEERAQAHQFVGVVRERVAEEESALDAVRRAKKRIQIGGEPSRKITAATAFSSSKRPKPKRRANEDDEEIEEEEDENSQEEEVMEIEVEEEEPIIEEEAEQLLPVPPNSEPLADDDQQPQPQQQPQLSQSTCGGGGLSPHRYVCPFPRCADLPAHRYVCQFPRCDKVYSRLYALRMHHRSHTKTQPYYCKFPVVVAAKDLPEDAQETATTTTADPAECGETFRRRANAARHVLAKHYGVPKAAQPALSKAEKGRALPYIGERAKVLAREEASLEALRVNKPRDPSRPPLKYRCGHPGCGKYFPAPGKLLLHQRTHSESLKPFFCRWEGCPKRAVTERATLLKHILREHLGVSFPRRTLLPAEEGAEAEEGEEEVVIGDEEGNQVRFTRPSTAEKPKSNATTSAAFSEAEKAAAAPYVGVHQHLLEQERRTVLTRTEEVVEERQGKEEEEEVTADYYGESGLTYRKKRSGGGGFNFQSFFSVPMSAPFPPVHYGPVFAVQIAVHKID